MVTTGDSDHTDLALPAAVPDLAESRYLPVLPPTVRYLTRIGHAARSRSPRPALNHSQSVRRCFAVVRRDQLAHDRAEPREEDVSGDDIFIILGRIDSALQASHAVELTERQAIRRDEIVSPA
ncbi:hypothetical protein J7E96_35850 [Streptomyces sp. ISL-96]|uniref:hypothetical protein n=1 Tax=Streptomyces sp. ISL-96 TaxID=2819191 RepID=UPI001BE86BF9|nr:hypothetical protein [Streptomyces sp. ISL-96]MBT2493777.1 hypothetical protein [Streptomyces sp. ISL-96]